MKQQHNLQLVLGILIILALLFISSNICAGDLTIPNTFSPGDTLSAGTMNDNFSAIETEVNDNVDAIGRLESLIVAYGVIARDGSIYSGSNISNCEYNASYGRYEITISREDYFYTDYITIVTPVSDTVTFKTTSMSGKLLVYLVDSTLTASQGIFSFLTLKP